MSYKAILTSAVAATLTLSTLSALAQPYDKRGRVIIIEQNAERDHRSDRWDDRYDGRRNDRRVYIGRDQRDDRREDRHSRRDDRHEDRYNRRDDRRDDRYEHRIDRRDDRFERHHHYYYYGARGPAFVRGHRLPSELRVSQYVVTDYHRHRLPPPPHGQHWIQVGGDYVLAAIATGIIASIILNH